LGSVHRKEKQIVLVADYNSAESAALQVRAEPVYEKPPARPVDSYLRETERRKNT